MEQPRIVIKEAWRRIKGVEAFGGENESAKSKFLALFENFFAQEREEPEKVWAFDALELVTVVTGFTLGHL